MNRLVNYIKNPKVFANVVLNHISPIFPTKFYLQLKYWVNNGKWLDLDNPQTFNEKLNWLKIHNHNPKLTIMADKYAVKEFVSKIIDSKYVVPCYGIWNNFEAIDFDNLKTPCVIKTTHDSNGVVVVRDVTEAKKQEIRKTVNKALNRSFYNTSREWPYKNIQHRIIADQFLDDGRAGELQDYKFWCFNGEPKVMYMTNKGTNIYENFYDMDFNVLDINHGFPRVSPEYAKPAAFEEMKVLAAKLSKGLPFVRVDLFYVQGKVYFGEYTFFDWAGMWPFANPEWDRRLGSWIDLSLIK